MGGDINSASGGMDTHRLSASERERQHREERHIAAARYLLRKGHTDLLSVLGLDQPAQPAAAFADVPEPEALVPAGRRASRKVRS